MSTLRTFSTPERVGSFGLLVAAAAVIWPALTEATGASVPCPLRTLTGIPCPVCGMTTAAIALVRGEVRGAFEANPMIFGLAALTIVAVPLLALRRLGVMELPRPWSEARRRKAGWFFGLLAVASWLFQLHRLGVGRPL